MQSRMTGIGGFSFRPARPSNLRGSTASGLPAIAQELSYPLVLQFWFEGSARARAAQQGCLRPGGDPQGETRSASDETRAGACARRKLPAAQSCGTSFPSRKSLGGGGPPWDRTRAAPSPARRARRKRCRNRLLRPSGKREKKEKNLLKVLSAYADRTVKLPDPATAKASGAGQNPVPSIPPTALGRPAIQPFTLYVLVF